MAFSPFQNKDRKASKAFFEHTQRNRQETISHVQSPEQMSTIRKGPQAPWWKAATHASVFGGWILGVIAIQLIASSVYNIMPNHEPVTVFHNFGIWPWYLFGLVLWAIFGYTVIRIKLRAIWQNNNALHTNAEVEEYANDSYVRTIDHLSNELDICPDMGLGFDGHASTLVGHIMVKNAGIKNVRIPVRDPNVDGGVKRDKKGQIVYQTVPMFDEKLGNKLFDMSNVPVDCRHFYDARLYDFNPKLPKKEGGDGKKRRGGYGRMEYDTLADVINNEFYPLDTETARPAGVYFYDRRPVNTILIAITRGGKGQTYIEPAFDVWMREKEKWNLFTTDPKGELLAKFYYAATIRGMEVIQFNLTKPELTNNFNPLINAIQAFRQNDSTKGVALIDSIVDMLFPNNGEIWNPAAGNMFRRAVYLLFDYYIEQERYIRYLGYKNNVAPEVLDDEIDTLYSKVTLYNVYSLIGELAAKVSKDANFINVNPAENVVSEKDLLTLAFDAMSVLPTNTLRSLAITANNAIKQITSAPQTIAGIYASLLTGLSIYADPTTIALMSGSLSEAFDVSGMAFPRRFGIRLDKDFVRKYRLTGETIRWSCYYDRDFTKPYEGNDFRHETRLSTSNWLWGYFKGIFEHDRSYIKIDIESSGTVATTFYFQFDKGYKTYDSITYKIDPITKKKIVSGGTLVELDPVTKEPKASTFETPVIDYATKSYQNSPLPTIVSTQAFYSERVKFVAAVTPPHLQGYQRHILIIIKQIIDEIYAQSYVTKANRKPIVGTRFMFEEFGNIRSGENGIPDIDVVTSIALGQDVQLTFVLQSFQQLRSLYSEAVEEIIRDNSANTVFLKSNNKQLIEELIRLSGTRHEVRTSGYSVQRKSGDLITVAEPSLSYNRSHNETSALKSNDLLFLAGQSPGNSITFMSSEMPIVNRQSTIMPMAAGLHAHLPQPKDGQYSDSTLPSTNTADGLNFLENTIDGEALVRARVEHARIALEIKDTYLNIAKEHEIEISERNGDLAELMMNTVYELYESRSGEVRVGLASTIPYYEIAENLKADGAGASDRRMDPNERLALATRMRETLVRLTMDKELDDLTVIYRDKTAKGVLGYDQEAVGRFIDEMLKKFPRPAKLQLEHQDVFAKAAELPAYTGYYDGSVEFDITYSYDVDLLREMVEDTLSGRLRLRDLQVRPHARDKNRFEVSVGNTPIAIYERGDDEYDSDLNFVGSRNTISSVIANTPGVYTYIMNRRNEG